MKSIFSVLILLFGLSTFAQDKLVDFNSNITLVKILEISDNQISYKKYDNLEGPTYKESKSLYSTIIFENGTVEVLNKNTSFKKDKSHRPRFTLIDSFQYNTLELDFLSFYTNDVLIQYTRYLKNKNMAITVPFRAGWINDRYNGIYLKDIPYLYDYSYNARRGAYGYKFLTGVNFKFFWRDKYKIRGYVAPEIVGGYYNTKISQYYYYYDQYGNYTEGYTDMNRFSKGVLGFMGTVGLLAYPNKLINFKLEVAGGFVGFLGKKEVDNAYDYYYGGYRYRYNYVTGIGRTTFSIGFNF